MVKLSKHNSQALYLYISTLLGSLLGFVTSVINTNFLSESDYGDVRYVQNLISFFSCVLLLGFFLSGSRLLAVSRSECYRRKVRGAMILVLLASSVILMGITCLVGILHSDSYVVKHLFIASFPVCFYPLLTNYINTTAQGDNFIGRLALARVLPAFLYIPIAYWIYSCYGATPTLMVLLQWGLYCLILVLIIASTNPSFKELGPVFIELQSENKAYGLHLYYGSLAMVATSYLAGVTLGVFNEDNVHVGYYTLALTLTTPLSYLPGIIGTVYFKKFVDEPRIPDRVMKSTLLLTVLSCICFVLFVRVFVQLFYPDSYAMVGVYAPWLAVSFSIHGIGDMINRFLGSHGVGKPIRNSSYACGLIKIVGFVVLVWLWDINGAIITHVMSSCVYCVALYLYYRKSFCIST